MEQLITSTNSVTLLILGGIGSFFVYMYKNPEKLSAFINATLIPFNRHSIRIIKPSSHPIFVDLIDFRDYKSKLQAFEDAPLKQKIWEIYMQEFFTIMHAELYKLSQDDLKLMTQAEFEYFVSTTFSLSFSQFIDRIKKRVELPKVVLIKLQKFELRQVESFKYVIEVWKNDKRFIGIKNANTIQIYNIFNDMQSRFRDFWQESLEFFTDFNGLLEKEARIRNSSE